MLRELPPTSGLPPRIGDLVGPSRQGALEAGLAALLNYREPQIESSGTACLIIALEYLKTLSSAREVIVPAYTCPLVVLACIRSSLVVILCDLSPGRFDLDEHILASRLGANTLCVIATHLGGWLTDVAGLRARLPPSIYIIEDAAQAFGAFQNAKSVGFSGDIGVFSFALGKGFTLYEGGALVSRHEYMRSGLLETARRLYLESRSEEIWRCIEFFTFHFLYHTVGLRLIYGISKNFWLRRGDAIRAIGDYFGDNIPVHEVSLWRKSIGARSLVRWPEHLRQTSITRLRVVAALSEIGGLDLHLPTSGNQPGGLFVLVTFPSVRQCDRALSRLWHSPLGVSRLFAYALGGYDYLDGKLQRTKSPVADDLAARTLTVTTSPWMTGRELMEIVTHIRTAMAESN